MSDLVGNPEDRFSRVEAHVKPVKYAASDLIAQLVLENNIRNYHNKPR